MQNHINFLEINHFKSIKNLKIDCKRVNVFIGKPNVGKSNILEAMALLGNRCWEDDYMRFKTVDELFMDNSIDNSIEVFTDIYSCSLNRFLRQQYLHLLSPDAIKVKKTLDLYSKSTDFGESTIYHKIDSKGQIEETNDGDKLPSSGLLSRHLHNIFKKYDFKFIDKVDDWQNTNLVPPNGINLYQILHQNQALRKEITDLFQKEYGLQFVLTPSERIFEIIKNQHGLITKYPYSSIADTFQRYIFYLAAIESNNDAVLIFEEPEVHSFPPYTKELASRIAERVENQFFITTHSPYLLHTLIEELGNDQLNVFLTYFDDYETKVKLLDEQAIRDIQDFSIDVFFNLDKFLHDA